MASPDVSFKDKSNLAKLFVTLNPVTLRNQIDLNVGKLWKIIKQHFLLSHRYLQSNFLF